MKTAALALAALLLASGSAAQAPPPPPPGWSGEAGLSYVQTAGNSQSSTIGAGLTLFYQRRPWRLSLGTSFIRTETDAVTSAEKFDSMLRAERGFGERLAVYGQGSFLRDPFAGIDGQETFEAGGLYKPAIGPRHFVALSAALAYTAEQRGGNSPDRNFAGARAGVAYKWQLSRNAAFTEELSYLQSFENSADGRVRHSAALSANINQIFALKLAHELLYFRDPVPGKRSTDNTILASIVAKWPAPAPSPPPCPPCP